jgi:DNA-binding IclR family transcriptional regulator
MTLNQIDKTVAEVRENHLARSVERPIPGVNAFSAPIFDHSGSIASAPGPALQVELIAGRKRRYLHLIEPRRTVSLSPDSELAGTKLAVIKHGQHPLVV